MARLLSLLRRIAVARRRARAGIWIMAATYALSVFTGAALVHAGHPFALRYRENLIGGARRDSAILHQFERGNELAAAALDAAANAGAAFAGMVSGYCPPAAIALAAVRGWVGGVVSVDDNHRSRLRSPYGAFYYLATILLQLVPYSLAGGAGVNLGIAAFASEGRSGYSGPRLLRLRIPHEALRDAGWLYIASLPLFAIASLFEFTM